MKNRKTNEQAAVLEEQELDLHAQVIEAERLANKACIKQEEMLRAMLLAVLAREHAILVGPHGCNKTRAINTLLAALNAANHGETFYATLDKSTPPEVLLGMPSIKAMKEEDRWCRNMKGKLPTAKFAFIGEVFRASAMTRASLHTIINERYIENDGVRETCPLHTLFCDSNSYPVREEDFPFFDRLLVRYHCGYIHGDDRKAFTDMLNTVDTAAIPAVVERGGVDAACNEVRQIGLTPEICDLLCDIRQQLLLKEITLSDRRWHRCLGVLRAAAWLRGGQTITPQDLYALKHILWVQPEQREVLNTILEQYAKMSVQQSDESLMEEARAIQAVAIEKSEIEMGDALVTLGEIMEKLTSPKSKKQLERIISELEEKILE